MRFVPHLPTGSLNLRALLLTRQSLGLPFSLDFSHYFCQFRMSGQELVCTDMASWHWGAAALPWYHCTKTMCWT